MDREKLCTLIAEFTESLTPVDTRKVKSISVYLKVGKSTKGAVSKALFCGTTGGTIARVEVRTLFDLSAFEEEVVDTSLASLGGTDGILASGPFSVVSERVVSTAWEQNGDSKTRVSVVEVIVQGSAEVGQVIRSKAVPGGFAEFRGQSVRAPKFRFEEFSYSM